MKKTEYLNEVGSFRLSEQFKTDLKAKMLEEYTKARETAADEKPAITVSGNKWKKYSKIAAAAACLLIAVSTASVLSIKDLKTGDPVREDSSSAESKADENIIINDNDLDEAVPVPEEAADENDEAAPTVLYDVTTEEAEAVIEQTDSEENIAVESFTEETPRSSGAENDVGYGEAFDEIPVADPAMNMPDEDVRSNDISSPQEYTTVDEESECEDFAETPQDKSSLSGGSLRNCINYHSDMPRARAAVQNVRPRGKYKGFASVITANVTKRKPYTKKSRSVI